MDFTGILAAMDAGAIVTALTAVAAIKILPPVVRWGYNQVIYWFAWDQDTRDYYDESNR